MARPVSVSVMFGAMVWLTLASGCGGKSTTTKANCDNLVRDNDETGVDCGGATCAPCGFGGGCVQSTDCASGACDDNGTCTCELGFGPDGSGDCYEIDDCDPNPCANGGTCTDQINSFACACAAGWTGVTCEERLDLCDPNPCLNGGSCAEADDQGVICTCAAGYYGQDCADACEIGNCQPGTVTCSADGSNRLCDACVTGYYGLACEEDIDECATEVDDCNDEADCVNTEGGFTCTCHPGLQGNGVSCVPCTDGKWGLGCSQACEQGNCVGGVMCDKVDGTGRVCTKCTNGFMGDACDEACDATGCANGVVDCAQDGSVRTCPEGCEAGLRTESCDLPCTSNTCDPLTPAGIVCDQDTGAVESCDRCLPSWTGADCTQSCSQGDCLGAVICDQSDPAAGRLCPGGCSAGLWGDDCGDPCVANHCQGTITCAQTTGNTVNCTTCKQGWWGGTCSAACIAPANCVGSLTCSKSTGEPLSCGGCAAGYYGVTCQNQCTLTNCAGTPTCNQNSGVPISCTECEVGWSGATCQTACVIPSCVGDATCNQTTGAAVGCSDCADGRWGAVCEKTCASTTCVGVVACEQESGTPTSCVQCKSGNWGAACEKTCAIPSCAGSATCDKATGDPLGCTQCVPGSWGAACQNTCVIEGCAGDATCDQIDGAPVSCNVCEPGRWGSYCQNSCEQGDCTGVATCDHDTGAPVSCTGCNAGIWGLVCDQACTQGECTGVVYCDQLTGVSISCSSCEAGVWGPSCDQPCTQGHCVGAVECDQGTGDATACLACEPGYWGPTCSDSCPQGQCVGTVTCEQGSGIATSCSGCNAGWWGTTCKKSCDQGECVGTVTCYKDAGTPQICSSCNPGFWGPTCEQTCAQGNCDGTVTCEQVNGVATSCLACNPGYWGQTCLEFCDLGDCSGTVRCNQTSGQTASCAACEAGFWGRNCDRTCKQGHCVGTVGCDPATGAATDCNDGCVVGRWGRVCENGCVAPANCPGPITCSQATGTAQSCAGCATGWTGTTCTSPICGDGLVLGNETCDDGAKVSGDGCSATCQREANFICPLGAGSCARDCDDPIATLPAAFIWNTARDAAGNIQGRNANDAFWKVSQSLNGTRSSALVIDSCYGDWNARPLTDANWIGQPGIGCIENDPSTAEVCDGKDNDGDGFTDEADVNVVASCSTVIKDRYCPDGGDNNFAGGSTSTTTCTDTGTYPTTYATCSAPAVSDSRKTLDLDLTLNVTHGKTSDLSVELYSPVGAKWFTLINQRGNANFVNTRLDDEAATAISSGSSPYTGTYAPDDGTSLSGCVDGSPPTGTWRLRTVDNTGYGGANSGTINNFTLHFSLEEKDSDGDHYPDACDCKPNDASVNPGATEVCDGKDNDCDGFTDGADFDVVASSCTPPAEPPSGSVVFYHRDVAVTASQRATFTASFTAFTSSQVVEVYLNGQPLGQRGPAYDMSKPLDFTVASGWIAGTNTVSFAVRKTAQADNPAALIVNGWGAADSDGDGVSDPDDACPSTRAGEVVNERGCMTQCGLCFDDASGAGTDSGCSAQKPVCNPAATVGGAPGTPNLSTGVNAAGVVLAKGQSDPSWKTGATLGAAAAAADVAGACHPSTVLSWSRAGWIAPSTKACTGWGTTSNVYFERDFDLAQQDVASFRIDVTGFVDGTLAAVYVNGASQNVNISPAGADQRITFTLGSGFRSGSNRVSFAVKQSAGTSSGGLAMRLFPHADRDGDGVYNGDDRCVGATSGGVDLAGCVVSCNGGCTVSPCQYGGTCAELASGYVCDCGVTGHTGKNCEVNVCNPTCAATATCTGASGTSVCVCNSGYAGTGTACSNVNECASGTNDCGAHASCADTIGGFTCTCNTGWTGDGHSCTDVNECTNGMELCDANANCTNTSGSYTCACKAGFSGDGRLCIDNDECASASNTCDRNAACSNTVGSYSCACNAGFGGSGASCASTACNTNPCTNSGTCSGDATPDGFTCDCAAGFGGTTCAEDDDECSPNPCTGGQVCHDPRGSATTACALVPQGAAAWWPGDVDGTDEIGGAPLELVAGATVDAGLIDGAFAFHGGDDAATVSVPAGDLNPGAGSFGVELWVRAAADSDGTEVLASRDDYDASPAARERWSITLLGGSDDGEVEYAVEDGAGTSVVFIGSAALRDGGWHHVAMVLDRYDGKLYGYVDGALDGSASAVGLDVVAPLAPVVIGAGLHGEIDEPTIYTAAIHPLDVANIEAAAESGKCLTGTFWCGAGSCPAAAGSIPVASGSPVAIERVTFTAGSDALQLRNVSGATVNTSGWMVCSGPHCATLGGQSVPSGQSRVFVLPVGVGRVGELAVYDGLDTAPSAMVGYAAWGAEPADEALQNDAVAQGLWSAGSLVTVQYGHVAIQATGVAAVTSANGYVSVEPTCIAP